MTVTGPEVVSDDDERNDHVEDAQFHIFWPRLQHKSQRGGFRVYGGVNGQQDLPGLDPLASEQITRARGSPGITSLSLPSELS